MALSDTTTGHPPEPAPERPGPAELCDGSAAAGSADPAELAGRLRAVIQHLLPVLRGHSTHRELTPAARPPSRCWTPTGHCGSANSPHG
ncbi:hypothetical protein PQR15_32715 [Streptomyces lydicus]|nr:hypothetical protein [Streptomyces lydicus]